MKKGQKSEKRSLLLSGLKLSVCRFGFCTYILWYFCVFVLHCTAQRSTNMLTTCENCQTSVFCHMTQRPKLSCFNY